MCFKLNLVWWRTVGNSSQMDLVICFQRWLWWSLESESTLELDALCIFQAVFLIVYVPTFVVPSIFKYFLIFAVKKITQQAFCCFRKPVVLLLSSYMLWLFPDKRIQGKIFICASNWKNTVRSPWIDCKQINRSIHSGLQKTPVPILFLTNMNIGLF